MSAAHWQHELQELFARRDRARRSRAAQRTAEFDARAAALDIATVLARIEQIDWEQRPEHWLWQRVVRCDVPRLRELLGKLEDADR